MTTGVIFPELLNGRDDEEDLRSWTIQEGSTMRGSASCNLTERVLEVPLGVGELERVVRAHELMHARVSPHAHHLERSLDEVSARALECAEEFRVNTLIARVGFDAALLRDGTEKLGGKRLSEAGAWSEAVCFFVAVLGTGGEKEYLAGVRQGRSEWLPALRAIRKRALAIFDLSTTCVAATRLDADGVPSGYAATTLVLARVLTQAIDARVPSSPEELRLFRRSLEPGARRAATGQFATLVIDETLARTRRARNQPVRRLRPSTTGPVLRYPGRLLTDEHRRAFVRRAPGRGGIVVIDQSGSMDLDADALDGLLRRAPDALVLGYSHRPGDRGTSPNAWLLCDRGTVATTYPAGNVGNGVDGPALRWALSHRLGDEPFVWVTDGQVTDSHDHPDLALARECADLVRRHRIHLAHDLTEATALLRSRRPNVPSRSPSFGRVGRQLRDITAL